MPIAQIIETADKFTATPIGKIALILASSVVAGHYLACYLFPGPRR